MQMKGGPDVLQTEPSDGSEREMLLREHRRDVPKIDAAKAPRVMVWVVPDGPATRSRNGSGDLKRKTSTNRQISAKHTTKRQATLVRVILQFNPSLHISGGLSHLVLASLPTGLSG